MATGNQNDPSNRASGSHGVRDRAADAAERVGNGIDGAPLFALAAGAVLGAVAGALLPKTDRETELLGPVGSKIGQAAGEAAKAARDAGKQELGLVGDKRSPLEIVLDKAIGALSAAGSAAGTAASSKVSGK